MENPVVEASYPLTFRETDAKALGQHLKNRHCVVLIGMKRVGISSFLRFFLYHKDIPKTFIADNNKHLFIPVDLNDLVEREIFPFWILTLKRVVDVVEKSSLNKEVKKYVETLFLDSIQTNDLFLVIESVRRAVVKVVEAGILPTIFFIRFDRMRDALRPEFFDNLQGLRDATHQKLSYVFTSFQSLDKLSPSVFTRASLSIFSHDMYIKPAHRKDLQIIFEIFKSRYRLNISQKTEQALFDAVDGYIQYLQLALIFLHELISTNWEASNLFDELIKDERITLQSEELWESLSSEEQNVLIKIYQKKKLSGDDLNTGKYLFDTGFIEEKNSSLKIFSALFESYLKQHSKEDGSDTSSVEFSKKEHLLFSFLEQNLNQVCERESIIEAVWPEVDSLGVSDWAIDRLVARLRGKLKQQDAKFEIITVKTRGYKLTNLA